MTQVAVEGDGTVAGLLVQQGIRRVALIDDAYDPLDQLEVSAADRLDLWTCIEAGAGVLTELEQRGHDISSETDLTPAVLAVLDSAEAESTIGTAWRGSILGARVQENRGTMAPITSHLTGLGLTVTTFGADVPIDDLIKEDVQLLFLDWYLGDGDEGAIDAAVEKAREILAKWPADRNKPLIVLMSSHPDLRAHEADFCRRSGILRGMFWAASKSELGDLFTLQMQVRLFGMSLPAGHRLQKFVDAMHTEVERVGRKFVEEISALTLNDYAYIQRLSLQDDGQPLGDYLLWLFGAYFGQLLFAEALKEQRAELDSMTFADALPNTGPPSARLAELYHHALIDTSVGSVGSHPRATTAPLDGQTQDPYLVLGDILGRRVSPPESANPDTEGISGDALDEETARTAKDGPDLLLVLNAQCDLAFTPDQDSRPTDPERSLLLLPGTLQPLEEPADQRLPKTELYRHEDRSYRVTWDTKHVQSVPFGDFTKWQDQHKRDRVGRLRLPFALDVQRVFAADLMRVGTPVMPPVYQPTTIQVLTPEHAEQVDIYSAANNSDVVGSAFRIISKDGRKPRCVLTMPLITYLKGKLEARLTAMRAADDQGANAAAQIESFERALAYSEKWQELEEFDLPGPTKPQRFLDGRIQVLVGAKAGDPVGDKKVVVAVSLQLE